MNPFLESPHIADRVQILEPELREVLNSVREMRTKALNNCFLSFFRSPLATPKATELYCDWSMLFLERQKQLAESQEQFLTVDPCDQAEIKRIWREIDSAERNLDKSSLELAKNLYSIFQESGDKRFKMIGSSAVDVAKAVLLLSSRIQVIKEHMPGPSAMS
ncbi:MAG: hypothetical protein JST01_22470 [Cyanobacteria bacterium SZAS TMP-1]|nr:hypothetical protein [Cyanobacteria bacterium SZAS TMP-1]